MEEQKTVSVLLICAYPKKYRLVMKQLASDGWKVSAIGNVKKALQIIMQKPPTHVFISANTPGIALLKIAKIITTTFNLPVVLFIERQDLQTMKAMREAKWPHTIPSSITANSIRNKIRTMSGEDIGVSEKEDGIKRFSSSSSKETGAGLIKIEGKLSSKITADSGEEVSAGHDESFELETLDTEDFGFRAKANQQMADDLKSLNEEWESSDADMSEDLISSDEVVGIDEDSMAATEADELLEAYNDDGEMLVDAEPGVNKKKRSKEYTMEQLSADIHKELNNPGTTASMAKKKNATGISEITDEIENIKPKFESKRTNKPKVIIEEDIEETPSFDEPIISSDTASDSKNQAVVEDELFDLELKQDLPYSSHKANLKIPDKVRGIVENSLYKVVSPAASPDQSVEITSDFVAFYLQSIDFAGIIYLAVGKNNSVASGIVGPYMKTLAETLRAEKIEAYVHRPVSVQVKPLNIKAWMKENTNFYCTTSHNNDEVVLGFVADSEIQPVFADSEYKGMFHVDVSHFPVSYPMNMDLYVYLPLNQKAVKYVAKEGYMEKQQKTRLLQNKTSAFHILNEDILLVRDFFVKLYTKKKVVA